MSTVFRSTQRYARVTFPPEQFGMGDGVEEYFDEKGEVHRKRSPWKAIKFDMGQVEVNDEKFVKMMRIHPGNEANGGEVFWEEKASDTAALSGLSGMAIAAMPDGGLTDEDRDNLEYLAKAAQKIAPKAKDNILKKANWLVERFSVVGMNAPTADLSIPRIRARLIELLGLLEDNGIWGVSDDEGKGNPGGASTPDPGPDVQAV